MADGKECMEFYDKSPTLEDIIEVNEFLALFGYCLQIYYIEAGAEARIAERVIGISLKHKISIKELWSNVFHEMSHILCSELGIFSDYHDMAYRKKTKKYNNYIRRVGLKVERYVDNMAKNMMATFLPDIPFVESYKDKESVDWYRDWLNNYFPVK